MKIAFLTDTIYAYASQHLSAVGGAERQQYLLARALSNAGWEVIVGIAEGMELGDRKTIDGVNFVGIGVGDAGTILRAWYKFLSLEKPDWWYLRGADHTLGLAVEIAKIARVRTLFSTAFDTDVYPQRALFRRRHWWPLYAWGLLRTDRILVQHRGQFSGLAPKLQLKANIIPSIFGETTSTKPHGERPNYVAWVGMLRQPKRADLLIDIAEKMPAVHFVVCGSPTAHRSPQGYGERIVNKLRLLPNIDYVGQVAPERAHQIIGDAAMLLCTSDGEGFPNTFLQAWSSGTPVVSLTIDPDHIIERNELGVVASTVENAIDKIQALSDSAEERNAIGIRACRYVEEHHSEAVVTGLFNRAVQANIAALRDRRDLADDLA